MYVYRIVVAAQMLESLVLEALELSKLTPNHIHENKFFVGQGPMTNMRLSKKGQLAAIEMASNDIGAGKKKGVYARDLRE